MKTFPSVTDLIAYCRSTPDTLCGIMLGTAVEQAQDDEDAESVHEEEIVDEETETACATAYLLQEALNSRDIRQCKIAACFLLTQTNG